MPRKKKTTTKKTEVTTRPTGVIIEVVKPVIVSIDSDKMVRVKRDHTRGAQTRIPTDDHGNWFTVYDTVEYDVKPSKALYDMILKGDLIEVTR